MDMHHRRLPAPSNLYEIPYLEELIKILNDGVMKVCRETYRYQYNSSIYKLEGWQINEGNLEYDGHAQGFDHNGQPFVLVNLTAPAVPTSACYRPGGAPSRPGEWLGIAHPEPKEDDRKWSLIAGPRPLRLTNVSRTENWGGLREAFVEEKQAKVTVPMVDAEGNLHELTLGLVLLPPATSDLKSPVPPSQVNFQLQRRIRKAHLNTWTTIHQDYFSLDLVLEHQNLYAVVERQAGERANVVLS